MVTKCTKIGFCEYIFWLIDQLLLTLPHYWYLLQRFWMANLNIFIDGTWLFRVCQPDGVLANRTESPLYSFKLDFQKLTESLVAHIHRNGSDLDIGDRYLSTSIFTIPRGVEEWAEQDPNITVADIEKVRKGAFARDRMVQNAVGAGFNDSAVYRPLLRPFMFEKLKNRTFQEKQVDATIIALLVRSAITQGGDFHAFVTGDSDLLPAIRVAYPEYSRNVLLVTTHPDELKASHRQTSFSYTDFQFDISPFFLQDHVKEIIVGEHVYECANCKKIFVRLNRIPVRSRPYCNDCQQSRT
jgi:hypothetical protein